MILRNRGGGGRDPSNGGDDFEMEELIPLYRLCPLSTNPTKWSNTLKQFVCSLPMNCLSVFDNFVGLALKGFTLR